MSNFMAKMDQIRFWLGLCAYSALPDPLTGLKEPMVLLTGKGKIRERRVGRGEQRRKWRVGK